MEPPSTLLEQQGTKVAGPVYHFVVCNCILLMDTIIRYASYIERYKEDQDIVSLTGIEAVGIAKIVQMRTARRQWGRNRQRLKGEQHGGRVMWRVENR
jgi:hypothetical protein